MNKLIETGLTDGKHYAILYSHEVWDKSNKTQLAPRVQADSYDKLHALIKGLGWDNLLKDNI